MSAVVLPELRWEPTPACSPRRGATVRLIVVHRWGVRYTSETAEAASYHGVINYFKDPAHQASAHVVYPGSAVPGEATQMVHWTDFAWTEAAYNPVANEVESADAIWLGHDPDGMAQLARIVAFLLQRANLPAVWSTHAGFCRHADLGQPGGGHLECPTVNMTVWRHFISLVQHEDERSGFRAVWGR